MVVVAKKQSGCLGFTGCHTREKLFSRLDKCNTKIWKRAGNGQRAHTRTFEHCSLQDLLSLKTPPPLSFFQFVKPMYSLPSPLIFKILQIPPENERMTVLIHGAACLDNIMFSYDQLSGRPNQVFGNNADAEAVLHDHDQI